MPLAIKITASVALKLPGETQLMQVPMIAGTSYMGWPSNWFLTN
jgi:hypothetical protein